MRRTMLAFLLLSVAALADEVPDSLPANTIAYVRLTRLQDVPATVENLPIWTEGGWRGEARPRM